MIESIRDRFVTGDWSKAARRGQGSEGVNEDVDDVVFGDFEDLETGQKNESHQGADIGHPSQSNEKDLAAEQRRLKKLALRAKFDAEYPLLKKYNSVCACMELVCFSVCTFHVEICLYSFPTF